MFKRDEFLNPKSCFNRARDHEMIFVLLARDEAAPAAIFAWIEQRIKLGKNRMEDKQIQDAIECAKRMMMKFTCSQCGWRGPYIKASVHADEPPCCPVCG